MDIFGMSCVGRKSNNNDDSFVVGELCRSIHVQNANLFENAEQHYFGIPEGKIMILADGISSHAMPETASKLALKSVMNYVLNIMPWVTDKDQSNVDVNVENELKQALKEGEEYLRNVDDMPKDSNFPMGAALTMCYVDFPDLYIAHAGHCRCYILRGGELQQLTRDHTFAQVLLDEELITEDQAQKNPVKNILTNSVAGGTASVKPEIYRKKLQLEDKLLLCSDQVYSTLADEDLAKILSMDLGASDLTRKLLAQVLEKSDEKDATAIVASF